MGPFKDIPAHPAAPVALIRPMKSAEAFSGSAIPKEYAPDVTCWKVIPVPPSVKGVDDWPYDFPTRPSAKVSLYKNDLCAMLDGMLRKV